MGGIAFSQIVIGILVCVALVLFYFILFSKDKTKFKESKRENEPVVIETPNKESQMTAGDLSDDSLIAILTAAVMASMQSSPDVKIRVTSFRRIPQSSPVWNTIGRRERMENKL
ncbi:OadG family protein [Acetivibrio cellulolyticus]|uniref:OadG family protein n=1 Tax=Acetivibrio cellulolyticus TaxID=35830 RepID=UPI0001E2F632|nr:OadG family protein [Acetivibrio cellulolyticus]